MEGTAFSAATVSPAKSLKCESPRGTLYHRERGVAFQAGCDRWGCGACGRRKAARVAARFSRLDPDYLVTLTVPPGRGWPTPENYREFQQSWRWFSRWLQRHRLVAAYGWVNETSDPNPDCLCLSPDEARARGVEGPRDCLCGAFGNRLHRHMLVRLATSRNRTGRRWLPYARMQEAAKRCGLGTIDCRPIFSARGAVRYVSKYLTKSIASRPVSVRRFAMNERIEEPKDPGWRFSWSRVAMVAVELLGAVSVDWDATYWSTSAP